MRLNIFNKKRYIKESEILRERLETTPSREYFIEKLNEFMRNPPLEDYKVQTTGKDKEGNEVNYSQYINFIKKIWREASAHVDIDANDKNKGVGVRINNFGKTFVDFKIFIYNKNFLKENQLKHSGNPSFEEISFYIENDNKEQVQVNFLNTGYGKSDIPNFYIQGNILYAKTNSKLQKATEAAESLVAYYFNKESGIAKGYYPKAPFGDNIVEAMNVISSDFEWDQSCKNNALGIINFLEKNNFKKEEFAAIHPTWIGTREKVIVINEYLDPSDIFLVKKQDFETNLKGSIDEDYKNRCKEEFSTDNSRTLGVSLKKLKLLIDQSVEKDKPSKEIFKTPNFFLTGWKLKSSPKVIYKKNPIEFDLKSNNYFVSNAFITVSNSRNSESGESGKTMYFKCEVNGEEELLFTIRKNGGENFVLEAAGSEGTESQGGKCSKLIDFVVKDQHFKDSLMTAIKNFNSAQEEAKKLANGEECDPFIIETEIDSVDTVLQRIDALQGFELSEESVKRAAIAFAFAKKLPFLLNTDDSAIEDYIVEAYKDLGFKGDTYNDIKNASPIFLGFGKDAYYS